MNDYADYLRVAGDLEDLRVRLEHMAEAISQGDTDLAISTVQTHLIDQLPTFGGDAPGESAAVLSWDESRILVTDDLDLAPGSLRLVRRDDWAPI